MSTFWLYNYNRDFKFATGHMYFMYWKIEQYTHYSRT